MSMSNTLKSFNPQVNGVKTTDMTSLEAESAEHGATKSAVSTQEANKNLLEHMKQILEDGRQEAQQLRGKQKFTYWLLLFLSTLMFLVGLTLLTGPIWARLWLKAEWPIAGGSFVLGVVDLYALYQLKPLARIQKIMGDMSQMTVVINSFQIRMALQLLEADMQDRSTIGAASAHLKTVATDAIVMIEEHFEKWLGKELDVEPSKT